MTTNPITLASIEAQEKLTGRLYFQPTGEVGYIDAGNVEDFSYQPEKDYVTHMASADGHRYVDGEQVNTIAERFRFTLNQVAAFNLKLIHLASQGSSVAQSAVTAPAGTATITGVQQGRSYFIGAVALDTVTVEVSAVSKTAGTDYTIDLNNGIITIIDGGGIADDDDIDLTYGCQAVTHEVFTGRDEVLKSGSVKFLETNQHSSVRLREVTFTGNLKVVEWPEQSGEYATYVVEALAISKPDIRRRSAA